MINLKRAYDEAAEYARTVASGPSEMDDIFTDIVNCLHDLERNDEGLLIALLGALPVEEIAREYGGN